jgi:hypothetical protein
MRLHRSSLLVLPLLFGLAACGADPAAVATTDAGAVADRPGATDVGARLDAPPVIDAGGRLDAPAAVDVARVADAAAALDATPPQDGPLPGLGAVSGACGALRGMLRAPAGSLVENGLGFMAGERYDRTQLSPGGQRLFDTPNAGGSSTESEVMSFELLARCEGAALVATETEVMYQPPDDAGANSITDMVVTIGADRVGVSVTRAYRPMPMVFTDAIARDLLVTKLNGVNRSTVRVLPAQRWVKQVLHVFAPDMAAAQAVARAWATLDAATRSNTIVLVTTTRGGGFIYCNPDPALGSECPPL